MLDSIGKAAKLASYQLAQTATTTKNNVLMTLADLLIENQTIILQANQQDIIAAQKANLSEALQDRLLLTAERLTNIANEVRKIGLLPDPIGQVIDGYQLESNLKLQRRRVPLGVIGVIYEARPNVTIDIASLCLKTGNAVILRGGKETIRTNMALIKLLQNVLSLYNLPQQAIQYIQDPDRQHITDLVKLDKYVDMIIPRGGATLQKLCQQQATIPVILGGIGVCHLFIDESMEVDAAIPIIINAKVQRPSACNSLETLLIHTCIADSFLPVIAKHLIENQVTMHVDDTAMSYLTKIINNENSQWFKALNDDDLIQEWLSKDINIVIVNDLDEAINHINQYGSQHSDSILTRNLNHAEKFVNQVDSAAVYINASTRFTDGAQFGLGAEVAVSTQKLHARGPMGLESLTTYKWIGYGGDLIRQ